MRTSSRVSLPSAPLQPSPRRALGRYALFGGIVAALITLPGLGSGTLWDNSETAYSEVAREILLTNDAILMHFNAAPYFIQPPMYFWIAALFAKVLGVVTLAFRLPSALATIVMGVVFARFVARYAGGRAARYATLILSTSLMQAVIGRLAVMDAMLDAAVMVTILAWFRAIYADEDVGARGAGAILGAIACAIGVLIKGPVAIALPLMILIPWAFWQSRTQPPVRPPATAIVLALSAFMLIAVPWYVMLAAAAGPKAITELIGHYTFGRYLGTIEKQTGPFYYYVPVLILALFPWTAFLFPAIKSAFARDLDERRGNIRGTLYRLAAMWSIIPFIFFSFAQTKLPSYLAVSLPGLALLCALWLDQAVVRQRRQAVIAAACTPVVIFALGIAVIAFAHSMALSAELQGLVPDALAFVGALFIGALGTVVLLWRRKSAPYAPYAMGAATIAAMLVIALLALPAADALKPMPQLAAVIQTQRKPGDVVALQGVGGENSLMFYTQPPISPLDSPGSPASSPQTDPSLVICSAPRVLLVAPMNRPNPDPLYGRRRRVLAVAQHDVLFLIDGPPCPPPSQ